MIELDAPPVPVEYRGWCPTDEWEGPARGSNLAALHDYDRHRGGDQHHRAALAREAAALEAQEDVA